jgi:hypothetical protein
VGSRRYHNSLILNSASHVSDAVQHDVDRYREVFLHAQPFKHVVIENFFEPAFADRLLADFPSFDPKLAINEAGHVGKKGVNPNIKEISPVYQELYDSLSAAPFLDLVSQLSGIPDLILDPKMFGGGTHDNHHGQELDPHVDFNYDITMQLHRRLNLIVYMNKEWKSEWGGAIEIHSNPRLPFENQVRSFDPLFNRAVMFETNEYSWHGFPRINLPPDKRHISRKSISIYLYTKERPAQEIAPLHGTFYVQRFLPERIRAGYTLTKEDADELARLLLRRDSWIELYQRMELEKNREIAEKNSLILNSPNRVRARLTGYIVQAEESVGLYADDWAASHLEIAIQPVAPVAGLTLRGWRPDDASEARIRLAIGDSVTEQSVGGGKFSVNVRLPSTTSETFRLKIDVESQGKASRGTDPRDLAFILAELRAHHPLAQTLAMRLR